jgi:hypothetical protein
MRNLIILVALIVITPASAGTMNCNTMNGQTWCSDPTTGYRSSSNTMNGQTFGHDNQGNRWTTNRMNDQSWTTTNNNRW